MAKPNDMPEFHSVKVSLTENISALRHSPAANAVKSVDSNFSSSFKPLTSKGGWYHV